MSDQKIQIQGFDVIKNNSQFRIQVGDEFIKTVKSIRDVFFYVFTPEAEAKKNEILAKKQVKTKLMKLK